MQQQQNQILIQLNVCFFFAGYGIPILPTNEFEELIIF